MKKTKSFVILAFVILICFSSCSLNKEQNYECPVTEGKHVISDEWVPIYEDGWLDGYHDWMYLNPFGTYITTWSRGTDSGFLYSSEIFGYNDIDNHYYKHAKYCTKCCEVLVDTAELHVFGPAMENHPEDTFCTICGLGKTMSYSSSDDLAYSPYSYNLGIRNLTLEEGEEIIDWFSRKWGYDSSGLTQHFFQDPYDETKYCFLNHHSFCFGDDVYLSFLNDFQCSDDAKFYLGRYTYKVSEDTNEEQAQYILDNLVVRNAIIDVQQRKDNESGELFFRFKIDRLLDEYQKDMVISLFESIGLSPYLSYGPLEFPEIYSDVGKEVLLNYHSGKEEDITVTYHLIGGPYQGMENVFELFTETGENRNPYIEHYFNGYTEILPPSTM